jgi:hypothetical protein
VRRAGHHCTEILSCRSTHLPRLVVKQYRYRSTAMTHATGESLSQMTSRDASLSLRLP